MAKSRNYEERTQELLLPIVQENGLGIYDVEYVKEGSDWYLRCYLEKQGGVTIDDCEKVSRALSDKLDEEDFIDSAYILEVSSPGLGRPLKKDKHLASSIGEAVEIRTYRPIEHQKEWEGILKAFDSDTITIQAEEKEIVLERADIALIRLALDF